MNQQPHQPGMLVQPSPLGFQTGVATTPQGTYALLQVETVIGTLALLIDGEQAVAIGEGLKQAGQQAKTGLIVPPSGAIK